MMYVNNGLYLPKDTYLRELDYPSIYYNDFSFAVLGGIDNSITEAVLNICPSRADPIPTALSSPQRASVDNFLLPVSENSFTFVLPLQVSSVCDTLLWTAAVIGKPGAKYTYFKSRAVAPP